MPRATLVDFFDDLAKQRGEFLVYDDGYRTWSRTYEEVARAARAFTARLRTEEIHKGEKIVFWSENRPEWVAAFWGCLLEGVIPVPVDYRSSAEFVGRIATTVQARAILAGEAVDPTNLTAPQWKLANLEWPSHEVEAGAPILIDADDIVEIVFTSGATAEPKGVIITHRNVLSNLVPVENEIKKYRKWARPFHPIRFLNLLPLSHMFGQSLATFIPPTLAGTVVFQRSYQPAEIARQIRSRRISLLVSVPKILEVLRDYIRHEYPQTAAVPPAGIGAIRKWWRYRRVHRAFGWKFWAFIVGAASLDPAVEEFWTGLGFLVIQGYGLTETAPIVTLNHPFHARKGTVGTPIGGVEVRLAEDGEVLVRGGNVSRGYYGETGADGTAQTNGWLHTGDIGEMDAEGRLTIRGRKKDMIVLPDGRKVFPEDVEAVLRGISAVRDCAVIGGDRVHAVLAMDAGANQEEIVRQANELLEEHQKIRHVSLWPESGELPRTPGTGKLKRAEIRQRIESGVRPELASANTKPGTIIEILRRYAPDRAISPDTTLDQLGLSSLDRVQLLMELEQRGDSTLDEASFTGAKTVADLERPAHRETPPAEEPPFEFPSWNRSWPARLSRRMLQFILLRPLTRLYARIAVEGLENLQGLDSPVIFAPNHESIMDVPAILCALPAKWRERVAPGMAKEWFDAHFHPQSHSWAERFGISLAYYFSVLFYNSFPLPQVEIGARRTLRYMGELISEGWSVLIFPEGVRTSSGELNPFRPGIAMLASHARVPVVPVRIEGLQRVLGRDARWPTRGPVRITFGPPIRIEGNDYAAEAKRLEDAVRQLSSR